MGKLEGNSPLSRPRHRWDDNFKPDLKVIGREVVDWIDLAQSKDKWRAVVHTVMNIEVP